MTNEQDEQRGFKVQDRRRFSESGEPRDDRPAAPEAAATPPPAAGPAQAVAEDVEMTFSTFVLSLSTQALAHLGEIPDPIDNLTRRDLVAARHLIDILGMLREKTKGNLDRTEEPLLDSILYDLRMRYIDASRRR